MRFLACLVCSSHTLCRGLTHCYIESTTISPQQSPHISYHDSQFYPQGPRPTSWVPRYYSPPTHGSSTITPPRAPIYPQADSGTCVFRHTQDLSGIVGSERVLSPRADNPNLNAATNEYLWAHGYKGGTIKLIQQMYEESESVTHFTERLAASGGISIAEAQYIYFLIGGGTSCM